MKKNIFDLNENLEYSMDYVYYNQGLTSCNHLTIAQDSRDDRFKCTKCFIVFSFQNNKQVLNFKSRIVQHFNFEKAEIALRREIRRQKLGEEDEE